jgi:hypothetical protein
MPFYIIFSVQGQSSQLLMLSSNQSSTYTMLLEIRTYFGYERQKVSELSQT